MVTVCLHLRPLASTLPVQHALRYNSGMDATHTTRRSTLIALTGLSAAAALPATALAQAAAPRSRLAATARYGSLTEWGKMRQSLARTAGVQDVRIDAIAVDGALLAILYTGTLEALRTALRRQGLVLSADEIGPVIRLAAS